MIEEVEGASVADVLGFLHRQLTVQEIATVLRHGLKPIIVVLNNSGYTIERLLRGGDVRKYNEITSWDWQNLFSFFDVANGRNETKSWRAGTRKELEEVLDNEEFKSAQKAQLLEVLMDKMDAPRALKLQAELVSFGRL